MQTICGVKHANCTGFPHLNTVLNHLLLCTQFATLNTCRSRGLSRFPQKPLLKFIYSNRAVRSRLSNRAVGLRCSNYSCFIRNHLVINVKYCRGRSMKVDDLFVCLFVCFLWSSTQTELAFCQAETETPFQKSWICHCLWFHNLSKLHLYT